jgi:hypothetical protein
LINPSQLKVFAVSVLTALATLLAGGGLILTFQIVGGDEVAQATPTLNGIFQTATAVKRFPTPTQEFIGSDCRVNSANGLNMRVYGTLDAPVIIAIPNREGVLFTGHSRASDGETWFNIHYLGLDGWVASRFLEDC